MQTFKEQDMFNQLLEGKDLKIVLRKEFPDVIFQILGPYDPMDHENGWYRLQMIVVPYKLRGQGLATKFMKRFIELAKKEKNDISLTPDDSYQEPGEMTKKDLEKWYKSLGFEKKHKDDFRMMDTMVYYS
jgi:predicted GNAT family acetyltransferase